MTKDEALKLALEALEWCQGGEPCGTAAAIAAIKEALAQPEQEPVRVGRDFSCKVCGNKPDGEGILEHGKGCYALDKNGGGSEFIADAIDSHLPVQEPISCARCKDLEGQAYDLLGQLKVANLKWSVAHPWVGLTDEDVFAVLEELQNMYHRPPSAIFAQAIEAKLKEKNT